MIDFVWKLFSQTGNIETYLLMKELENDYNELPDEGSSAANLDNLPVDTNL
ncbi:YqzL family protein [Ornithinibacillus bavariensis]|uniref:YqzL family protein n=1 Tax=Ornithinibacillus bavariensis TaxID=545502 RepID=A0A919X7U4_9BACI|nr:YqzL family protein [Ornithinibacillus bavariensis]GIO27576.1 YqzL family protein [Ornithinibacillus bavariensis]HAM81348.1 YqzL family protein [Ornithinibacillus sp.]